MTAKSVVVFDYGSGNVHSAVKALRAAGADAVLSSDKKQALEADGLLVPGVGAFAAVKQALDAGGGSEVIERRLAGGRGVLGICVGMQVLFAGGDEHGVYTEGLGEWPGDVTQLVAPVLPHIGWSKVAVGDGSRLFAGLEDERFYFVHSYAAKRWELEVYGAFQQPSVTYCTYGEPFIAAVENGPLCATQFHPEKSGDAGLKLLSNWIETL